VMGGAYTRPPITESRAPIAILTNIFLIHALALHPDVTWNFPSWSISVEFYSGLRGRAFAGSPVPGGRSLGAVPTRCGGAGD
jgi:hypothetical protein